MVESRCGGGRAIRLSYIYHTLLKGTGNETEKENHDLGDSYSVRIRFLAIVR